MVDEDVLHRAQCAAMDVLLGDGFIVMTTDAPVEIGTVDVLTVGGIPIGKVVCASESTEEEYDRQTRKHGLLAKTCEKGLYYYRAIAE